MPEADINLYERIPVDTGPLVNEILKTPAKPRPHGWAQALVEVSAQKLDPLVFTGGWDRPVSQTPDLHSLRYNLITAADRGQMSPGDARILLAQGAEAVNHAARTLTVKLVAAAALRLFNPEDLTNSAIENASHSMRDPLRKDQDLRIMSINKETYSARLSWRKLRTAERLARLLGQPTADPAILVTNGQGRMPGLWGLTSCGVETKPEHGKTSHAVSYHVDYQGDDINLTIRSLDGPTRTDYTYDGPASSPFASNLGIVNNNTMALNIIPSTVRDYLATNATQLDQLEVQLASIG